MNWTDLLQWLKEATATENFDNIDDSKYYTWLSWSHTKIAEFIKAKIDSKFFFSIAKADTVLWQYKYDWLPVNVIDTVFIKYKWDTDYRKATVTDVSENSKSIEYLAENQPKEKPLYFITNEIIMVFPKADDDITKWLSVTWLSVVSNITASSTSSDIFNWQLAEYQDLIIKWAEQYVYKYLQEFDKESKVRNEFIYEDLERLKTEISYRWSQPIQYEEPDLSYLLN